MYKKRTTIQISDTLRKKLKVLSSYRDISYEELIEDLINVFIATIPFRSDDEFREWFEQNLDKLGFKRIVGKGISPSYRLEDADGRIKNVEVELIGEDFERHEHDPNKTDLVICLFSTKERIKGVPVLSIIKPPEDPREVIYRLSGKFKTVSIPTTLYNKLKEAIKNTGFTNVSSFVSHILREVLVEKRDWSVPLTKEEEEKIIERLRTLGYLD